MVGGTGSGEAPAATDRDVVHSPDLLQWIGGATAALDAREVGPAPAGWRRRGPLLLAAACATTYALVAAQVVTGGVLVHADHVVQGWAATHQTSAGRQLAAALTNLGSPGLAPAVLLALAAALAWRRRGWRPLRVAAAAVLLLAVGVLASKAGFDRAGPPGPAPAHSDGSWGLGRGLVQGADHGAFPSGHATTAIVTWAVGLWLACGGRLPWLARLVVAAVAVAVGGGLVYVGYHWLSDVLAAGAFGPLIVWVALRLTAPQRPAPDRAAAERGRAP